MADHGGSEQARRLGAEMRSRRVAGGMSLRGLAKELGLSGHGTLVDYEYGRRIPPEDIVTGCERIFQISDGALRNLREKALAERASQQADLLLTRSDQTSTVVPGPKAEGRPTPVRHVRRRWLVIAGVVVVVVAGLGIGIWRLHTPTTPQATSPLAGMTSGPSCSTGAALPLDTSGSWTTLDGHASAGCSQPLIHQATDSGDGANWIFHPGVGKTCMFRVHIPNSNVVTARNVTYQAWDTQPGEHHDIDRIGDNVHADQQANRGGTITVTFGPTKNGTIDLQLYDNFSEHAAEVADTAAAVCR
jgi:transcriptional regulator with XRE-family HTH domain